MNFFKRFLGFGSGQTPQSAQELIDAAVVQALLDKGAKANAADENGWAALMRVSQNGHREVARTHGLGLERENHRSLRPAQ
jgi:ankyrin repeat protein